ncbi:MAG: hypothetical protein H0U92_04700 [Actinobacteria bacterium]|nr:hypothetical protein [Actinomycetota bacterium]
MDLSSPELVAGRAVAVFALERIIRDRTAFFVWSAAVITAVLIVGTIASDGVGALVVGAFALIAAAVTFTLFAVRAAVLRALRLIGGGRDYVRMRPIVERHMSEVQRGCAAIPTDRMGVVRLAWMARRPAALQQHVRETATAVARTIPEVVADVRTELARPGN